MPLKHLNGLLCFYINPLISFKFHCDDHKVFYPNYLKLFRTFSNLEVEEFQVYQNFLLFWDSAGYFDLTLLVCNSWQITFLTNIVCCSLISNGERYEEETFLGRARLETLRSLCRLCPNQILLVRTKCVRFF